MLEEIGRQLIQSGFLPHGYCLSWSPPLVGTYIVSDALIAVSYFSMPLAMAYFGWKRPNFHYKWLLWMFIAFILSCGTTHLMGTVVLWQPVYWLDAILRAITGIISAATAIALWPMIPRALSVPSHAQMQAINEELRKEIEERRRVEEALKKAHEELQALHRLTDASLTSALHRLDAHMSNSPLAIVEFDPESRVTRWSQSAEQLFGWPADEIVGRSINDIHWVHEDDRDGLAQITQAMLSGASPRNQNSNRNYRKDGSLLRCEWYNSAVYDDRGRLVSILSLGLDVTERERVTQALQESETRFRATFEQAAVGMAHVSLDGHWLQVNDRLCEIVGYEREVLLSRTFQDITYPPDLTADLDLVNRLLAGTVPSYSMEKRYIRADSALVWINLTASLVHKANGEPDYFISVVEDIEARKQMEATIREGEEKLQLFIRYAPAALAMFDQKMRYLAASRRWLEDFSLPEDIYGRLHYQLTPDIPERWKEVHQRGLAGMVVRAETDRFERADGSVQWKRWEVRPWRTHEGTVGGIVIFSEDITSYKEAEEEIKRLNADLELRVEERTAELMAANRELDSFAYAISHDLRAPLRAINGFSQILAESHAGQLDGDGARCLQQIRLASRRMGELIDGILTLSRITRDEPRRDEIDLSAMAEHLLDGLAAAEPQRQVRWEVEPGLKTQGDARMVESVMGNLLDNAWKYTARTPEAVIRVFREGEDICVADNGAGFDPEHGAKLFQPFRRLHSQEEFPGIGIGLATVQRIIQRHGGSIRATGAPGKGATFRFSLKGARNGDPQQP